MAALEDFAAQEATLVAAKDFAALAKISERTAPLIELLAQHGPAIADEASRARVRALLKRRQQTDDELSAELVHAKQELQRTRESEQRVAQIASAYSRSGTSSRQLSAVG